MSAEARPAREPLVDPVVATTRCRVWTCRAHVEVTQTALDALTMFNAELGRRGEKPIELEAFMLCTTCAPFELARERTRW